MGGGQMDLLPDRQTMVSARMFRGAACGKVAATEPRAIWNLEAAHVGPAKSNILAPWARAA
jgi:hypothetical protein